MPISHLTLPIDLLKKLCRKYYVRELALFGSVLRDDFQPDSDIDFLVEFETGASISFFELTGLQRALSDLIGRKVDVVVKDGLKPVIRDQVINSAKVIYAQ